MAVKDTGRSWLGLCAVTYTFFLENGTLKGLSVLLPDLKEQLGSETWIIGSCISIMACWGYLLGLSASPLKERFGTRFCFMLSGFISSIGLIVCACATNEFILLLGIVLTGFMLLQENIAVGIVPEYFDRYYNIAVNVYCFGSGLAVVVFPLMVQTFLDLYGWRGALLLLSGLSFQSFLCGAIEKHSQLKNNEKISLVPKGTNGTDTISKGTLGMFLRKIDANLLTSPHFIARVIIPGIVNGYTWAGWVIYIVSFALSIGASMREASVVASCGGIGLMIIRIILPFLNQVVTYRKLLYISSVIMTTSLLMPTFTRTLAGLCITSLMYCIGNDMLCSELYVAVRDTADATQYVSGIAWYHLFSGFAMTFGGVITGLIFDVTGSIHVSFILLSAVSLLTCVSLGLEDMWKVINNRAKKK